MTPGIVATIFDLRKRENSMQNQVQSMLDASNIMLPSSLKDGYCVESIDTGVRSAMRNKYQEIIRSTQNMNISVLDLNEEIKEEVKDSASIDDDNQMRIKNVNTLPVQVSIHADATNRSNPDNYELIQIGKTNDAVDGNIMIIL